MTADKRPLKVFLCHAHADRDPVRALYTRLTNDGVDAWLDKEKLLPGQDWELEIKKAVREADVVVVCLSKQFNQAGFRQKEVRLALDTAMEQPEGEIFIIPTRLEECDIPESLRKWHWVDLFEESGYNKLLRSLHIRAGNKGIVLQTRNDFSSNSKLPVGEEKTTIDLPQIPPSPWNINRTIIAGLIILSIAVCFTFFGVITYVANNRLVFQNNGIQSPLAATSVSQLSTPTLLSERDIANTIDASTFENTDATMLLIPSGEFTYVIESRVSSPEFSINPVSLKSFYIDQHEVTNNEYDTCVAAGVCSTPEDSRSRTRSIYYGNPDFSNFPVIYVTWSMAKTYCEWRGARLPSAEEWDKAARGENGDVVLGTTIDCTRANYLDETRNSFCLEDTSQIGSYFDGRSPYDILDMTGNVWEWVANDFSSDYLDFAVMFGRQSEQLKLIRGGAWTYDKSTGAPASSNVSFYFGKADPNLSFDFIGFRCVKDAP